MPEHIRYEDDDLFNPETHHEKSDVNVKALLMFGVAFVVFAAVMHFVLFFMYRQFVKHENNHQHVPLTKMERPESMTIPQIPRLQPFPTKSASGVIPPVSNTPVTDMEEMRNTQEQSLNSYGYVDRQKGVVHIPIDEAKKLALQRGFLSVPPAQAGVPVPQPVGAKP